LAAQLHAAAEAGHTPPALNSITHIQLLDVHITAFISSTDDLLAADRSPLYPQSTIVLAR
jgi:hypothetical protein